MTNWESAAWEQLESELSTSTNLQQLKISGLAGGLQEGRQPRKQEKHKEKEVFRAQNEIRMKITK